MVVVSGQTILALDVGSACIGMAVATTQAKLAHPAGTLQHDDSTMQRLREMCERERVGHVVIGLPRGLSGQETAQTATVRAFGAALASEIGIPISWQDEAVTSAQAEAELKARGRAYAKEEIDALAATYILEDYLHEQI